MRPQWGRSDAGTWPHPKPIWTLGMLVVAMLSVGAMAAYQFTYVWTPLQRTYLSPYLRSAFRTALGFTAGRYQLLTLDTRQGNRLALAEEVQPVTTPTGETAFALREAAVRAGDRQLAWRERTYHNATLHAFLAVAIYPDQSLADLMKRALWGGLGVFVVGLIIAIPRDVRRARDRREGRRLKGPELVRVAHFNRRVRADGIGFIQHQNLVARVLGHRRWVRLPRAIESSHLLIMGDTGTGKSAIIRQLLCQLEARGDTAIVYDPALEYTPQFYTPGRGDLILNPLDARSPYWTPGDEIRHDAEALTLATSLFPDQHNENPFFTGAARRIFAHLLTLRPTPQDLAGWLCHGDELDRRVAGTAYASMIDRQALGQRGGVLASLNMVADALTLLPAEHDTTQRWSAEAWAVGRRGWLFLTSTPETRQGLVPLTSLWLDLLVLRLRRAGATSCVRGAASARDGTTIDSTYTSHASGRARHPVAYA